MVHVRFEGRSYDLDEREIGVRAGMDDEQVKGHIARHFDVSRQRLDGYVLDRAPNGNLVVRPEAVYG